MYIYIYIYTYKYVFPVSLLKNSYQKLLHQTPSITDPQKSDPQMLTNLCFLLHFGRSISLSNGRSRVWLASTQKQETGQTGFPVFWGTWHWVILSKWGVKRFLLHSRILKRSKFPRNNKLQKKKTARRKMVKKNPTKASKSNLSNQKNSPKKHTKTTPPTLEAELPKSVPNPRFLGKMFWEKAPLPPLSSSPQPWLHSKPQPQWPEADWPFGSPSDPVKTWRRFPPVKATNSWTGFNSMYVVLCFHQFFSTLRLMSL